MALERLRRAVASSSRGAELPPDLPYQGLGRHVLLDGDVLLFQGTGPIARLIRWAGRTRYSHAGLVLRSARGRVLVAEAREGLVGSIRLVPLSNALKGSVAVDVYRVRPSSASDRWDDLS